MKKEKILVSACLLGTNCKYDGKNNINEKVIEYLKDKEVIPVCPEILGGLSTPRQPAEVFNNKVITKDGKDVTKKYIKGAEETLYIAKLLNIKKAILKSNSPSCGNYKIYDGTFRHNLIDKAGITSELLMNNNIEILNENEL